MNSSQQLLKLLNISPLLLDSQDCHIFQYTYAHKRLPCFHSDTYAHSRLSSRNGADNHFLEFGVPIRYIWWYCLAALCVLLEHIECLGGQFLSRACRRFLSLLVEPWTVRYAGASRHSSNRRWRPLLFLYRPKQVLWEAYFVKFQTSVHFDLEPEDYRLRYAGCPAVSGPSPPESASVYPPYTIQIN